MTNARPSFVSTGRTFIEIFFIQQFTFTTVFVDTRLWKTKHSRKRFQKFPSIIRVIDMSDRNPPITATNVTFYVMLAGFDWWISIRHVDNTYD